MPRMKPSGGKTSSRPRKSARARKATRSKGMSGAGMILLGLVCVLGAVMLIAARESAQPPARPTIEPLQLATDTRPPKASTPRGAAAQPGKAPNDAPMASVPPEDAPAATAGRKPAPVAIAGCLERGGDTFRLKDATGANVPKARSWKSGFLKKGSASVDLVDPASAVRLRDHLGQRVSVTGVLVDREMQVRSLRRLAATCN